jgi:hypothetical protein
LHGPVASRRAHVACVVRKAGFTTHVHSLGDDGPQAPFCAASDAPQRATTEATDLVSCVKFSPPGEARRPIGSNWSTGCRDRDPEAQDFGSLLEPGPPREARWSINSNGSTRGGTHRLTETQGFGSSYRLRTPASSRRSGRS